MKPNNYIFNLNTQDQELPLISVLQSKLNQALGLNLSRSKIRRLIVAGAVYLNKTRATNPNKSLLGISHLNAYVDLKKLQSDTVTRDKKMELSESQVIFEDDDIIVIDKPAGLPTQATVDNARDHLFAAVIRYLKNRDGHKLDPYVGMHHRLDYSTSGVILFTKRKSANPWVAHLFRDHKIAKTYLAVVLKGLGSGKRSPGEKWEIKNHIDRAKNKRGGKVIHMQEVHSGGDFAHTEFEVIEDLTNRLQLVRCQPKTGRTHQIRVHLNISGMPILGDTLYGGPKSSRIFLHAHSIQFRKPNSPTDTLIQSPIPNEFESQTCQS